MPLARQLMLTTVLSGESVANRYADSVIATSPLAYWRLNETTGTAITDSSGNGYNGTYSGVDLASIASPKAGDSAPLWGTGDYGDVYSAGLASAFDLDEGCMLIWVKVDAGFWTDSTEHYFVSFWADVSNRVQIIKTTTNNTLQARRVGTGTSDAVTIGSQSSTDWFSVLMSWSVTGDALDFYINGSQVGSTQTGLVSATGSIASTISVIGALNTTSTSVHEGYLSHCAVWTTPATADIIALATP